MKSVSNDYKNQIKQMGRELDSIVTYYKHYKIISEDGKYILTEDGKKILTEQINANDVLEITSSDLYKSKLIVHGDLLKTMMKEFDFETTIDLKIGSIVNFKMGVKINNEYEYIDYGDFIVYTKTYNEASQTYSYQSYDFMLYTMIPFKAPKSSSNLTMYNLVSYICEFCGLNLNLATFPNSSREISYETLKFLEESNFTFRDILDYATQTTGCSSWVVGKQLIIGSPTEVSNNLPSEYTQVEYIDVSASAYIDIGFPMQSDFRVEGKISGIKHATNDRYIIGEYPGYLAHAIYGANSHFKVGRYGNNWVDTDYSLVDNEVFTFDTKITPTIKVNINNENVYNNPNISNNFTSEYNGALFIYRYNGNVLSNYAFVGKCYYVNIYDKDDIPLRKFVPCIKNSNNEVGMYDLVSDTFYGNNGTGSFIAGAKVVVPFDASYFQDTNVKFDKVVGPINSVLLSRSEDTDYIEIKDDTSIEQYGVTQIKIKDNPFLEDDNRSEYLNELFNSIKGLTYTLNDLNLYGVTYLDFMDLFKVQIKNNTYPCLLLNDEIVITQGLEEKIFTEESKETTKDYVTSSESIDDISLRVDKANKQIVLKVDSNGKLAQAELKQNADNGTEFNVKADNINLEGYTTINNGFSVDLDGNMTCNKAILNEAYFTSDNLSQYARLTTNGLAVFNDSTETNFGSINDDIMGVYKAIDYPVSMWTPLAYMSIEENYYGYLCLSNMNNVGTIEANGNTGNIFCNAVNPSKIEKKKNIEVFTNGLDIVKDVDIYKYNYKYEEDDTKKRIGFIIGNNYKYRKEITSTDNEGADLYSMVSVLWQAVKEQQEEIEKLKERVGK